MGLLQSCWSELLILDHLCRQVAYGRDGCICLITGQQVRLSCLLHQTSKDVYSRQAAISFMCTRSKYPSSSARLELLSVVWCAEPRTLFQSLSLFSWTEKSLCASNILFSLTQVCLHSHLHLSYSCFLKHSLKGQTCVADVKSVQDRRQVEQTQERVNKALMDHTMQTHPGHSDKFGQLLLRLPEVRSISLQVEEYLYQRHLLGDLPCNSLLTEMLHAKHT